MKRPGPLAATSPRTRILLCAVAPVLLLSACRTYNGSRAIVPFFEIIDGTAATAGPGAVVAPEGESVDRQPSREIVVRPIGSFELIGPPSSRRNRLKFLWPLGDFAWGQGDTRGWILPIFYLRDRPYPDRPGSDFDWTLFPLLFYGSDPEHGSYFAVFPLGGVLKGLLAKDRMYFALFPLYWQTWEGEFDSLHILFPFFKRESGGGHSGWRLWPFYGNFHAERVDDGKPRYRRKFIAWPFYIRQSNNLDSDRPTELLFLFPFYGQSINARTETYTYLWPFFNTTTDVASGDTLYFGYLLPYRFTGGQFDLWPLFGWKSRTSLRTLGARDLRGIASAGGWEGRRPEKSDRMAPSDLETRLRQFTLFPVHRWDRTPRGPDERTKLWALPLLWNFQSIDKDTFETTSEWKIWPLFRYRRDAVRGSFYFPSPLWFRQENLFERLYARLWRLFLWESGPERSGWEFLYGFLSYRNEKVEDESTFSILYGLFEWSVDPGGHSVRLFYLPWR